MNAPSTDVLYGRVLGEILEERGIPEPEDFCAAVAVAMTGREWSWLADETGINVDTLKYQLVINPDALKLRTGRRVATALNLTVWGEAA